MKNTFAFFDFDGTLTNKDTLTGFTKFLMGDRYWLTFLLFLPIFISYKLNIINQNRTKKLYLYFFLRQYSEKTLIATGENYANNIIDTIINPNILKRLNWHKENKHSVYIITASLKYWIEPWCKKNNINLICTNIEISDGKVTGNLLGRNCFGEEKVNQIQRIIKAAQLTSIFAYGDSIGDYPMLTLADYSYDCSKNTKSPYTLAKKESWYAE